MLKFMIFSGGKLLNTVFIDDPVITVGRLAENTIPLAGAEISRRHLRIEEDYDGSYILNDLDSLNGTVVNTKPVRKVSLNSGDIIVIGSYSIIFEKVSQEVTIASGAGASATKSPLMESTFETAFIKLPSRTQKKITADDGFPILLEMPQNRAIRLDKNFMTLGNAPADDITVSGFMIGRRQAFLRLDTDGWRIGTHKMVGMLKVNGRAIKTHLLQNKDHIEIGSSTFRFIKNS
jgi:pSer/pThr/pTyr-binding forkhead associated (FHA) protein